MNRAVNSLFAGVVPRVAPDRAMLENCARAHCGNVFQSGFTVPQSLAQFDSLYRQLQQHPYFYDYDYFPVVVIGVDPSLQSEYVMPAPEVGYPEGIAPAVASVRIDHMDRAIYIDFPTADYADQLTYRELVFLLLYSFMFFEEAQSLPSLNPATIVEPGILMLVNQCIDAGSLLYQQQFSDSVRGQIIDNISIISEGTVNSTEATAEKQAVRDALRELLNPPAGWSWPLYFRNILSVLLGWNHPDQKLKIIIADKPKAGYPGDDTNPYGKYDATSNTVCLFRHQFEDYENGKRVSAANLFTGQYMASVLLEELLHGAVCPLDTLLFLRAGHFSGYKTENLLRGFDWENFTKSMAENVGSSDRETRRYMIVREILKAADQVHYYLQREQVQELMGSRFVPPGQEQQVDTVGADSGIEHEVIINLRVDWRYRKLRQSGMDHKKALSYANVVNRTRLGCHSGIDIVPQTLLGRIGNEIVTAEIQLRQDEQAEDTYYLYTNYQNQFWRVGRCLMQIEGNSVSYIFHFDRQFSYFRLSTDVLTTVVNCLRRYHEAVQPRNVTVHIQDVPAEGRPFVVVHHDRDRIRKVPVQPILSGIADLEDAPASKNDFCGFELDSDEGESVWVRVDPDKGIEYGIMARVGTAGQREFIVADSETQAMMEEEFGDEIFELPEARRFFREQQRQQRRIRQAV